jgi:hypothetical protein
MQEMIDCIDRSNHPIWLGGDARNARNSLLQTAKVGKAMREDGGPDFCDMKLRTEILGALSQEALLLERILRNYHGDWR